MVVFRNRRCTPTKIVKAKDGSTYHIPSKAERLALVIDCWNYRRMGYSMWDISRAMSKIHGRKIGANTVERYLVMATKLQRLRMSESAHDAVAMAFYDDAKHVEQKLWDLYNKFRYGDQKQNADGTWTVLSPSNFAQAKLVLESIGNQQERRLRIGQSTGIVRKVVEPMAPSGGSPQPMIFIDLRYEPAHDGAPIRVGQPPELVLDAEFHANGNGSPEGDDDGPAGSA